VVDNSPITFTIQIVSQMLHEVIFGLCFEALKIEHQTTNKMAAVDSFQKVVHNYRSIALREINER